MSDTFDQQNPSVAPPPPAAPPAAAPGVPGQAPDTSILGVLAGTSPLAASEGFSSTTGTQEQVDQLSASLDTMSAAVPASLAYTAATTPGADTAGLSNAADGYQATQATPPGGTTLPVHAAIGAQTPANHTLAKKSGGILDTLNGWLGGVGHVVGDALKSRPAKDVEHVLADVTQAPVAKQLLGALNSLGVISHVATRAGRWAVVHVGSPYALKEAPAEIQQQLEKAGYGQAQAAKMLQENGSPQHFEEQLAAMGYSKKQIINMEQHGTLGQILATSIGGMTGSSSMRPGTPLYNAISGAVDATVALAGPNVGSVLGDSAHAVSDAVGAAADAREAGASVSEAAQAGAEAGKLAAGGYSSTRSASAIQNLLQNSPSVKAGLNALADTVNAGQVSRLSRAYGWGFSDDLAKMIAGAGSPEEVSQMVLEAATGSGRFARAGGALASPAYLKALQAGAPPDQLAAIGEGLDAETADEIDINGLPEGEKVGSAPAYGRAALTSLPHLNPNTYLRTLAAVREHDIPTWGGTLAQKAVRVFQRTTRIVPGGEINIMGSKAAGTFSDLLHQWLPDASENEVDSQVSKFIEATPKGRQALVHATIEDGLRAKGFTDKEIEDLKASGRLSTDQQQLYSVGLHDNDHPVLSSQIGTNVPIPSAAEYKRLTLEKDAQRAIQATGKEGLVVKARAAGQAVTGAIQKYQRPFLKLWLAHPAWAEHTGLDEMFNFAAQNPDVSKLQLLKAIGASWADAEGRNFGAVTHGLVGTLNRVLDHMGSLDDLRPSSLPAGLEMPQNLRMATHHSMTDWLETTKAPTSAAEDAARQEMIDSIRKTTGVRLAPRPDGSWERYDKATDPAPYVQSAYHVINHQMLNDPMVNNLLHGVDDSARWFATDAAGGTTLTREAAQRLKDLGRDTLTVGGEDMPATAMPELVAAFKNHQADVAKLTDRFITKPGLAELAKTGMVTHEDISAALEKMPAQVWGPGLTTDLHDVAKRGLLDKTFFGPVSKAYDATVRSPAYQAGYKQELDRLVGQAKTLGVEPDMEQVQRSAARWAAKAVGLSVHNPAERTAMDIWLGSWMPFSFARVQFLKRWGRVMASNPAFLSKAVMLQNTLTNDGVFTKNQYGEEVFTMPFPIEGSGSISFAIGKDSGAGVLSGIGAVSPPELPFSGDIIPGFGPAVSLPIAFLATNKHTPQSLVNGVLGPIDTSLPYQGAADRMLNAVVPSWIGHLTDAVLGDEGNATFGGAVIDAMKWKAFNGENLADPQVQLSAKNQARELMVLKAAMSLFSPYSSTATLSNAALTNELFQDRQKYGDALGTQKFLTAHPTGLAMTVSTTQDATKTSGGTPTGIASEAGFAQFQKDNPELFSTYPNVAGFFAPPSPFSDPAYQQLVASGARPPLSVTQWLTNVMVQQGNNMYYGEISPILNAVQASGAPSTTTATLRSTLQQLVDTKYPGWLAYYNDASNRSTDRAAEIEQLITAANTPALTPNPAAKVIRSFGAIYTAVQAQAQAVSQYGLDGSANAGLKAFLQDLGAALADKNPAFANAWAYLFQPQLGAYNTPGAVNG